MGNFTPVAVPANAFQRHLVDPNGGKTAFDLYVMSWQPFLKDDFKHAYRGFASVHTNFEINELYMKDLFGQFDKQNPRANVPGQISYSYAVSHGAMMVLQDELGRRGGEAHDRTILVRPDLMLFRDIVFHSPNWEYRRRTVHLDHMIPTHMFTAYSDFLFVVGNDGLHFLSGAFVGNTIAQARGEVLASHHWLYARAQQQGFTLLPGDLEHAAILYRSLCMKDSIFLTLGYAFFRDTYGMTREQWEATQIVEQARDTIDQLLQRKVSNDAATAKKGACCNARNLENASMKLYGAVPGHWCCFQNSLGPRGNQDRGVDCTFRGMAEHLSRRISLCRSSFSL